MTDILKERAMLSELLRLAALRIDDMPEVSGERFAGMVEELDPAFVRRHGLGGQLVRLEAGYEADNKQLLRSAASRLRSATFLSANDQPFRKGQKVWVYRTRHGWHDGRLRAEITRASQNESGRWSYTAAALDEAGKPYMIDIRHTNDARLDHDQSALK